MPADETFTGQVLLLAGEGFLLGTGRELFNGGLEDIAQAPFRLDEEVAGKDVARVLDDDVLAALAVEGADRGMAAEAEAQDGIEVADAELLGAELQPAVENAALKVPVLLRRDGELGDLARLRVHLHARDELQIAHAEIDQEIEHLVRMVGREMVDQRERVEFDLMLLAAVDGSA